MRNLCVSLRSIFPDPHPSLPPFRRSPSSDSLPPPTPFPPLTRSLSLDRSFLTPPPPASAPAQFLHPRPLPAAPDSQACSPAIPAGDPPLPAEKAPQSQRAQPPPHDVSLADPPPLALADSVNPADRSSASLEPAKSSDEDDGSIAWRLFGKGWECVPAGNGAWDDLAVGKPVQKSLGNCRKIKMHHCTEALGSESSDAHEDVSSFDSLGESKSGITISEAEWKPSDTLMQHQATLQPVLAEENDSHCDHEELRSLGHKRKFPPPLTLYSSASACRHHPSSDSFSLSLRPYRKNGRFVLEEVRVPCRQYLRASRGDGRLRLDLVARTYNDDFARTQIYCNDLLEEEAELEILSQSEEWEVAQTAADTDFNSEDYHDDIEEMKEESERQITRTQPMIPIPKTKKSRIGEKSSSSGSVGEKRLFRISSEKESEVIDSPIPSLTSSLSRSKRKVEQLSISKNKVEPHQARSLPCVRYNLSAPLMNGDPLSPSSYSASQGFLKQQTLACHDMSSRPLLSDEKPCRSVDGSNDNFSEKKLLLNCYLSCGVLPRIGKMNRTIVGRLEEGSRVLKFFGLEGHSGSEEQIGKSQRGASFEGARSLPSHSEWDFQISLAGIYDALRRHDRLYTLPCKKELEVSELDKCLKLHWVATNS